MTFGSLFAGIGGLDLGLERAGMTCKWQVEIDDYARRVLAKHWPLVRRWDDVRTWPQPDTEPVDLICGGFPCQPVSVAGKRKGRDDERWLWDEFRRVIEALRPTYVLGENVPGLLSADDGRLFGGILADLAMLGFDAEWDCIRTGLHRGHQRMRVFIVAYANGTGLQAPGECHQATLAAQRVFVQSTVASLPGAQFAPAVVRNVHGIPRRVDRIRALGNAVVPQVAEWIGKRITEVTHVDRH